MTVSYLGSGALAVAGLLGLLLVPTPTLFRAFGQASCRAVGFVFTARAIDIGGAVDGLNVVVPFGDKRYYELRPSIAIPAPNGGTEAAIDQITEHIKR